jgi:hypothetical protein
MRPHKYNQLLPIQETSFGRLSSFWLFCINFFVIDLKTYFILNLQDWLILFLI